MNHSNSCADDFFLHWALGHCLDITGFPACIPPIILLCTPLPLHRQPSNQTNCHWPSTQATSHTQHTHHVVQSDAPDANAPFRLLWGIPDPVPRPRLANNPSCTRRKRHKIAENSTLLPVHENSMCLTPRKLRYVTAPPISTRELVLVRLGCMCRWTPLSPGRLASDSTP